MPGRLDVVGVVDGLVGVGVARGRNLGQGSLSVGICGFRQVKTQTG